MDKSTGDKELAQEGEESYIGWGGEETGAGPSSGSGGDAGGALEALFSWLSDLVGGSTDDLVDLPEPDTTTGTGTRQAFGGAANPAAAIRRALDRSGVHMQDPRLDAQEGIGSAIGWGALLYVASKALK